MSLEILTAIVAGLSVSFIGLLILTIRRVRPGLSMRLGIARPRRRSGSRKTKGVPEIRDPAPTERANTIARRRTLITISQADTAAPAPMLSGDDPFGATIIGRLEQTFSLLERGRISLATYAHEVGLIRREVLLRIDEIEKARLSRKSDPDLINRQMHDASSALEAITWCQEWSRQQAAADMGLSALAFPADSQPGKPSLALT